MTLSRDWRLTEQVYRAVPLTRRDSWAEDIRSALSQPPRGAQSQGAVLFESLVAGPPHGVPRALHLDLRLELEALPVGPPWQREPGLPDLPWQRIAGIEASARGMR